MKFYQFIVNARPYLINLKSVISIAVVKVTQGGNCDLVIQLPSEKKTFPFTSQEEAQAAYDDITQHLNIVNKEIEGRV